MMFNGGALTVYFTKDDVYLLDKLKKIKKEKGTSSNKIIIAAVKSYLDIMESVEKKPSKKGG